MAYNGPMGHIKITALKNAISVFDFIHHLLIADRLFHISFIQYQHDRFSFYYVTTDLVFMIYLKYEGIHGSDKLSQRQGFKYQA